MQSEAQNLYLNSTHRSYIVSMTADQILNLPGLNRFLLNSPAKRQPPAKPSIAVPADNLY